MIISNYDGETPWLMMMWCIRRPRKSEPKALGQHHSQKIVKEKTKSVPTPTRNTMSSANFEINSEGIPESFICPINLTVMREPVMDRYGNSYERSAIQSWINSGHQVCPLTRRELRPSQLVRNSNLKHQIENWRKENSLEDYSISDTEDAYDDANEPVVVGFANIEKVNHGQSGQENEARRMWRRMSPEERAILEDVRQLQFPNRRRTGGNGRNQRKRGIFRIFS